MLMLCLSVFAFSCKDDDSAPGPTEPGVPTVTAVSPLSGTTGTEITITGKNFKSPASGNTVTFNGIAATVKSGTATQLVVEVPDKAGDGVVVVTVGDKTLTGPAFDYLESYRASTFVGSSQGMNDGTGTSAQLYDPWDIAIDGDGNMYVTDYGSHRIRKITPAGVVTTFAGSTAGYRDGTGSAAQFNGPTAITLDAQGNLYVTEDVNHRIRKITPEGVVTTVAGSGIKGFTNGAAAIAQFSKPSGILVDAEGMIFVADRDNNRIRKITPEGIVSTFAGSGEWDYADGTGAAAKFRSPSGLSIDADGNLIVSDTDNHRIRKITMAGVVSTIAGNGTAGTANGVGTAAQLHFPWDTAITPDGVVIVADYQNHLIRMIAPDGKVTTVAGSGTVGNTNGIGSGISFNGPSSIEIGADGNLYVVDNKNFSIRKLVLE